MKTIIGALALLIAAPVTAQTAPAEAHAGHSTPAHADHSKMDHSKMGHSDKDCCKDGKADCCDKMRQSGTAMDCCAKDKAASDADQRGHASQR